jgi:cytochrome c oxidase subunit 2
MITGRASIAALIVGLVLVAQASCGGTETPLADPQLQIGKSVYAVRCASCHGSKGQGVTGPRIGGGLLVRKYPDVADHRTVVVDGRNAMPKFSAMLSGEDIDAVVRYTRESLGL